MTYIAGASGVSGADTEYDKVAKLAVGGDMPYRPEGGA